MTISITIICLLFIHLLLLLALLLLLETKEHHIFSIQPQAPYWSTPYSVIPDPRALSESTIELGCEDEDGPALLVGALVHDDAPEGGEERVGHRPEVLPHAPRALDPPQRLAQHEADDVDGQEDEHRRPEERAQAAQGPAQHHLELVEHLEA